MSEVGLEQPTEQPEVSPADRGRPKRDVSAEIARAARIARGAVQFAAGEQPNVRNSLSSSGKSRIRGG